MRRIRAQTKPEDLDILEIFVADLDKGDEATTEYPHWFLQLFIKGVIKKELETGGLNPMPVWKFNEAVLGNKCFLVYNCATKQTIVIHTEEIIYSRYTIQPPKADCLDKILPPMSKPHGMGDRQ